MMRIFIVFLAKVGQGVGLVVADLGL